MRTFEQYNIDDKEQHFLEISHFNELEIKFDFIKYPDVIFYFYKNYCLFSQDTFYENFNINTNIWTEFSTEYQMKHLEISEFMYNMLDKYFKLCTYSIRHLILQSRFQIEKNFNI